MHKKIGILLFMVILIILPVITLLTLPKEKKPFSENENRYLSEFPELDLEAVIEEDFMNGFDSWLSDRFYGREIWISAKNNIEEMLGKTEISTVYTKDDQMLQILSEYDNIGAPYSTDTVETNLNVIQTFADKHPDTPVYFMLCPTSVGIYGEDLLPEAVKDVSVNEIDMIDDCYSKLSSIGTIHVEDSLFASKDEYIYYRTDHHWTSLGAYKAYAASSETLGFTPYNLEDFNVVTGSTSFQGTLFSKTLDQSVTKDAIDMYTLADNSVSCTLTSTNGVTEETFDSIFFPEYLEVKDKYSTYTGQNAAIVTIDSTNLQNLPLAASSGCDGNKNQQEDKSLLIIKDSYANSMVQFLANNYTTITMIDLRYMNQPFSNLINVDDYDQVLFLYNCITFSDDGDLIKLNME